MKAFAICYAATLVVMAGLDAVWLTAMAGPLYRAHLGALLLPRFNAVPAIAFYVIYGLGLVGLAGLPALAGKGWGFAATRGALLGFVAYATYDLTNQATRRGWSPTVTLADVTWGTLISAVAATGGYLIARKVLRLVSAPGGRAIR